VSLEAQRELLLQVVDIYTEVLTTFPEEETLLINRGATYLQLGQLDKAIADFNTVLTLNPESASALRNRALAFESANDLEAAYADYNSLLEVVSTYETWRTIHAERILELEAHLQELGKQIQSSSNTSDASLRGASEGSAGATPTIPVLPTRVRTYSWLGNLKMHNAVINGVQYDNLAGWTCGAWYTNVSNVENIVYFSIHNTAWNHRAYILDELNNWMEPGWYHFYGGTIGWTMPSGQNYVLLVPETWVCLGYSHEASWHKITAESY
jgi:tetratricopeptide (TPR) repeat protein